MVPVLVEFGPVVIRTYGVLAVIAALTAVGWAAGREAGPGGLGEWRVVELSLWAIAGGLLAAKLPLLILPGSGWNLLGSGGFFDLGVAGGALGTWLWARRGGVAVFALVDRLIPAAPLAGAIGRLGCLGAGCCWGSPTSLPWAVVYCDPGAHALSGVPLGVGLHPAPLYVLAVQMAMFVVLLRLGAARLQTGAGVATWAVLEGLSRMALDPTRGDPRGMLGPLSLTAVLGGVMLITGGVALLRLWRA